MTTTLTVTLPVLPIKRTVLFPGILMPVTVGRERSVAAVNAALKTEEKMILVVAQRDPSTENPGLDDLYTIGTKAIVKQVANAEDGTSPKPQTPNPKPQTPNPKPRYIL